MKGVILVAGLGKRLRPLTFTTPKPLIPVAREPVLLRAVEILKDAGIKEQILVVNPTNEVKFREFLGDGSKLGIEVRYAVQEKPLGLAHALRSARDLLENEDFVMYLGDNIILEDISEFIENLIDHDAVIALKRVDDPRRFGVAVVEGDEIVHLVEKPEKPPSDLAIVGLYAFKSSIFKAIDSIEPSWRGEYEITDAIAKLVEWGKKVKAYKIRGWWKDIGKLEDLLEANSHLLKLKEKWILHGNIIRTEIDGMVEVGESSEVQGSKLIGPVTIGDGVMIRDSMIGPNVSIGNGCIIEGSSIRDSILMNGIEVRGTSLEKSVLGNGVKIENMRNTVNAFIGDLSMLKGIGHRG